MKKIWQKSLASMVSAALCLTAFVGCLTVNAADYEGTVTSEGVSVTTEKDQATVTLTLSSDHAMNVAAIKVLTEYGSLASVNVGDYKDKNYKIEGDFVILDTGKLLIEAIDNDAGFTTADVVLTFNKAADIGVGTYPVQVSAFAGETAATWDEETVNLAVTGEINITVESAHTHAWGAGVMTTMPTTTSNGVITYTCECGETKTEDFVVSGGAITPLDKYTFIDVAAVKVQYAAKITSAVFSGIGTSGGTVTNFGMLLTKDGSVPVFGEGTAVSIFENKANNSTANSQYMGYFQGMNFAQMGQTLTFRPYVKFTFGDQECYYYGDTYSKVFIDEIRSNADAQSAALVSLYDNKATATNISSTCTGTQVAEGNTSITNISKYTLLDMTAVKLQYAAKIPSTVFSGIGANGGTVTNFGMLLTKDGSVPVFGEGTAVSIFENKANNSTANSQYMGYFQGMNFKQMGQTLTFRPYVTYTDAEGATAYEYGAAVSFVYIDVLTSLAGDNAFAAELLSYYNTYIAK